MRNVIAGALFVAALFLGGALALAQDAGPTQSPAVTRLAAGCDAPADALVVLCVESTTVNEHGQFAGGAFYAQAADRGLVRLTECDDLIVACRPTFVRAEGVAQGDAIPLAIASE